MKSSAISRAMAGSVQADAAEALLGRRVLDDRNYGEEEYASDLYGILRTKSKAELIELTVHLGGVAAMGKQVLIAMYIDWVLAVTRSCQRDEGEIGCDSTHQPKEER